MDSGQTSMKVSGTFKGLYLLTYLLIPTYLLTNLAIDEWTVFERWTEFGERLVNSERTQNANGAQKRWTQNEWFVRKN